MTSTLTAMLLALCALPLAAEEYLGQLGDNRFEPNSTSNPYGQYGSQYSPDSINNPYGAGNRFDLENPTNPYGQGLSIYGDDDG